MAQVISWADRFGFTISAADRALLETQFHVRNPEELPNRRPDIPPDLDVEDVEFAYHIEARRTERHLWIRCCECQRNHNHRRGLVLRFADQTRATLGRDCGRDKHSLNFDSLIDQFEGRMKRGRLLKQTLDMLTQAPVVYNHLRMLRADKTIAQGLRLKDELARKLPDLSRRLVATTNGRISAKVKVRDLEAEKQRDARLDRKLDTLARQRSRNRDEPGIDRELLADLVARGDEDASKQPIMMDEKKVVHTFSGHQFYSVLPRAGHRAEHLETQLLEAFSSLSMKASANVSDRAFIGIHTKFLAALRDAISLTQDVEAAFRLTAPGNMTGIVRAHNRFSKPESPHQIRFDNGVLSRANTPDRPLVDTRLQAFGLSAGALTRLIDQVGTGASLPEAA